MEITEIKNQNQWWRWPLIPIVSITGALITSYLIKIIGIFIFNFLGFGSNSWMQRYFLAALVAGYFGSLLVKISYFTAPNRKLKVARIFAWLFFVFNIANIAFAFLFHIEGKSVIR